MSARRALWLLGLLACQKPAPPTRAIAASPTRVTVPPPSAPDAGGSPGRFACDVRKTVMAHHAMNVYREDTRASLVLTLAPGGTATGGRGMRSLSFNDGPDIHGQEQLRQQQGYRGRWLEDHGTVTITLTPDDAALPPIRPYRNLAPKPWRLECRRIERDGPALLCQLAAHLDYEEGYGLLLPRLVTGSPERRILLGAGDGLAITWRASSVEGDQDRTAEVEVHPAAAAVRADTWSGD